MIRKVYKEQRDSSLYIVSTLTSANVIPGHPGFCDFGTLKRITN